MRLVGENEVKFQLKNSTGPMGPAGPAGADGKDGETGPQGSAGADGQAATIEIVDAVSLAYGSKPTVMEEAGSTPQARKYRLGIPEGKPGTGGTGDGGSVEIDTTLTQYGQAADAGAVGNAIGQEKQAREQAVNELKEANAAQNTEIAKKLNASELPTAINTALEQAKESGQFDGKDGAPGAKGVPGDDYVLTEADKEEIAEMAAELVEVPEGGGGGETLVADETVLASGVVPVDYPMYGKTDTGLTVSDLRNWKVIAVKLKTSKNGTYGVLINGNQLMYTHSDTNRFTSFAEWVDSAKTVFRVYGYAEGSGTYWDNYFNRSMITNTAPDYMRGAHGYKFFGPVSNETHKVQIYTHNVTTEEVEWSIIGVIKG